eukprot:COSAG05_NODE_2350_length_3195_cov_2.770995_2_plen_68_part_00
MKEAHAAAMDAAHVLAAEETAAALQVAKAEAGAVLADVKAAHAADLQKVRGLISIPSSRPPSLFLSL